MLKIFCLILFCIFVGFNLFIIIGLMIQKWKLRKASSSTICEICGDSLGVPAVKLAKEIRKKVLDEAHIKSPGIRINFARVDAVCCHCKTEYRFVDDRDTLVRSK